MAYWQNIGNQDGDLIGFGGLDESLPVSVRPLNVPKAVSNLVMDNPPVLSTIPGYTAKGAAGAGAVNGIHVYRKLDGTTQLLRHVGTVLERWDGAAWVSAGTGLPDAPSTSANLNNVLCIFTGSTAKSWNGAALSNLAGAPQGSCVVEAHQQLFVVGINGREGDVDFCDVRGPTTWTSTPVNNAGSLPFSSTPAKWIAHDKIRDMVLMWTTTGLHFLAGPETPEGPGTWGVQTMGEYGTLAGRTVQNLDGMWIWLTDGEKGKGFAFWSGGTVEVDYKPIATSFALIDGANVANATAWTTKDGRYICCAPKTGGGVLWFVWDRKTGWTTGAGADVRASGSYTFSGVQYTLIGDANGYVHTVEGTKFNGSDISWSLELEGALGDPFRDKSINELTFVISAASGATVSYAVASGDGASWGTSSTLTPSAGMTAIEVPLRPTDTDVFRLRLSGTGVVTIHGYSVRYRVVGGA